MTLPHRINATAANVIQNITSIRWDNVTEQWGGMNPNVTGPPNWGVTIWQIVSVYPDFLGQIAWFILFSIPFIMMWIGHADVVPAAILGVFFGLYVYAYIGDQYQFIGIAFIGIALSSIVWSLWQKRG